MYVDLSLLRDTPCGPEKETAGISRRRLCYFASEGVSYGKSSRVFLNWLLYLLSCVCFFFFRSSFLADSEEQQRLMSEARRLQFEDQRNDGLLGVSTHGDEAYRGACASIGSFVRVYVENLPRVWIESLHSSRPVLLGGLCAGEQAHTFLQV